MIPTSIRATWSRTCTSFLAIGALAVSTAAVAGPRLDTRPTRLATERIGIADQRVMSLSNGPELFSVRLLNSDGSVVTDVVAVHDAQGNIVSKVQPAADGTFAVASTPGQKLALSPESGAVGLDNSLVGLFYAPPSNLGVVEVTLPAAPDMPAFGTHSAQPSGGGFQGVDFGTTGGPAPEFVVNAGSTSCATAVLIAVPGTDSGNTTGAPVGFSGGVDCSGLAGGSEVLWYRLVGTGGNITVSLCGSSYDTVVNVWRQCGTGCSALTLTCVAGNDDFCGLQSQVTFPSVSGTNYIVAVTGFLGGQGAYVINTSTAGVATGVPCPPPPVPTGACCITSPPPFEQGEVPSQCTVQTQAACEAAGGVYGGDDVPCETGTVTFRDVDDAFPNASIPDNNVAGVTSVITVPPGTGTIVDVNVEIDIQHTWDSDLIIDVTHNSNTERLWNRTCGATDNIHATADDEGTETFCAPIAAGGGNDDADGFASDTPMYPPGVIPGGGTLNGFDGGDSAGPWSFNVSDRFPADVGVLQHWGLELTTLTNIVPECPAVDCPPPQPCDSCCPPCPDPCPPSDPCADPSGRTLICHVPAGNPENAHEIVVGNSAVPAHLAHGDTCGPCSAAP